VAVISEHSVKIERWTGTCPCCGAKRSIIKKPGEQHACCEKCGLCFTDKYLEEYAAKTQDKEVVPIVEKHLRIIGEDLLTLGKDRFI